MCFGTEPAAVVELATVCAVAVVAFSVVVLVAVWVVIVTVFLRQPRGKLMPVILLSFRAMEIPIPVFAAVAGIFPENSCDETDFHVSDYCWIAPMMDPGFVLVSLLPYAQ